MPNWPLGINVDVIGADVVLSQADDCCIKTLFTVMITTVLRDVATELSYLHLASQVPFECCKQDFPQVDFETIHQVRNRAITIVFAEESDPD